MAWNDYNNSNKSIIVQLFGGQQRSSLQCSACGKESVTFEPFFNLSLPIPQSSSQCNIMVSCLLYLLLLLLSSIIILFSMSIPFRTVSSCIRNLNRSVDGRVRFVSTRKVPVRRLIFGSYPLSSLFIFKGSSQYKIIFSLKLNLLTRILQIL